MDHLEPTSFAFHNLPAASFPLRIEALHPVTREVVWSSDIQRPAKDQQAVLHIPALRKQLGHPVAIRIHFGDGTVLDDTCQLLAGEDAPAAS